MPKNNSSFTDSRVLIAVRNLPEKREVFMDRIAQLPSRWPFKVENPYGAPGLSPAESRSAPHQERSSFIT